MCFKEQVQVGKGGAAVSALLPAYLGTLDAPSVPLPIRVGV